jgi:hypothetical protein
MLGGHTFRAATRLCPWQGRASLEEQTAGPEKAGRFAFYGPEANTCLGFVCYAFVGHLSLPGLKWPVSPYGGFFIPGHADYQSS